ncbi:DUF6377 domain-containing protein [Arthrospiribacter ruber]|uniref:DUF6377 domain-containing protein n=1 Tax=Arthrospiribacter ruber TaxID=2487934 RepID=A0A951IT99_9BACT|nr:DUF6377 domain-containing protein [Arthrospiribacter ruber]MBW3467040.1 hypothetical protein [Arthrospiribacter ruber]
MMKRFIQCSIIITFAILKTPESIGQNITGYLKLIEVIDQKEHFESEKRTRIAELREKIEAKNQKDNYYVRDLESLHKIYLKYNFDSAIHFGLLMGQEARRLNREDLEILSRIKIANTLISAGIYGPALDSLNKVFEEKIPVSHKEEFFFTKAKLFFDMADYNGSFYFHQLNDSGLIYLDSALIHTKDQSLHGSYSGLKLLRKRNFDEADMVYSKLLKEFSLDDRQFAVDASAYSYILEQKGNKKEAIDWLVEAAILDIKTSNKENLALIKLSQMAYEQGELDISSKFLLSALEDAITYGAIQRKFQILDILPVIDAAKLELTENQKIKFQVLSIGLVILSLFIIVFLVVVLRQYKKLKEARDLLRRSNIKLKEANLIKEEYIGYFFKSNTEYMQKLEKLTSGIDSKLINNKIHEIKPLLAKYNQKKERQTMFNAFDSAFLKIFPDFVPQFNSLFLEENQILLKDNELLNTDLRIFALMRLGITDTEKIALILNYSVSTIHSYKSRIKSKSIKSNEEFEDAIKQISSI